MLRKGKFHDSDITILQTGMDIAYAGERHTHLKKNNIFA